LYNAEHPDGQVLFDDVGPGKAESYGAELDDFANAVLHGTPLAAPPEYALGELRTALAMYRSSESGQWEDV
jgi:predicted dehydrogenase